MKQPGTVAKIKAYSEAKKEGVELPDFPPSSIVLWGARLLETTWFQRVLMRVVAALCGSLTVWLVAHNAGDLVTPIVTGVFSAVFFAVEILSSWLHKKAGIPDKILVRPDVSIVEMIIKQNSKITPVTEAASVEAALQQTEDDPPSSASGQRLEIPGALERIGFPDTQALAAEVKRLLPPAPEERVVEFREQFSETWQRRICPNFREAVKFRDEMRAGGLIANILPK